MFITADTDSNQTFIMFTMKTELLVSLLCVSLSVSAAAVVPVDNVPGDSAAPSVPGTTHSSCPQKWHSHQDSCYLLINLTYAWSNAEFLCESLGSSLASAHNLWEYSFLQQLASGAGHSKAWIGGYRFQGYWKWDDGTPFNYKNWYQNQVSSGYDCAYLNSEGSRGWSNDRCNLEHPSICSFKRALC